MMRKRRRFTGCLLFVCAYFAAIVSWLLIDKACWWLGCGIHGAGKAQGLDISGEYLAEIKMTRLYTAYMDHPFLPDSLAYSNAHVTITQYGSTNMTAISQSPSGAATTNNIVIGGWRWRWCGNRLEYARTAIGPGLGFGIPGIVTYKSKCHVEALRADDYARRPLRIKLVGQCGGLFLFIFPWADPEDVSEIMLVPTDAP